MMGAIFGKPLIIVILLTPVCLLLAIGSGGAGHGDHFYAKLLYPYTLLFVHVFDSMAIPSILSAVTPISILWRVVRPCCREREGVGGRSREHNHARHGRRALLFAAEF